LHRYIQKQVELAVLEVVDRASLLMTRSLHKLIGLVFIIVAYIFLMVALALYLGPRLGHVSYGYLVVGGVTGGVGVTLAATRPRWLSRLMQTGWVSLVYESMSEGQSSQNETKNQPTSAATKESTSN
jgi:hypothetical protein